MGTLTRIPPYDGTLRLYVDGTNGNDANSGVDGWANAWKTLAKVERAIAALFHLEPNGLDLRLFVRGAFNAENLAIGLVSMGTSRLHIGHAYADMTEQASGTITVVGGEAPVPEHGLRRLTVSFAVTTAMLGSWATMTDGAGKIATTQIIDVDTVNSYLWTSHGITRAPMLPAWVVGGGSIAISVRTPSMSGISQLVLSCPYATDYRITDYAYTMATVIGLSVGKATLKTCHGVGLAVKCTNTVTPMLLANSHVCDTFVVGPTPTFYRNPPDDWLVELGFMSAVDGSVIMGSLVASGTVRQEGGTFNTVSGYFGTAVFFVGLSGGTLYRANARTVAGESGTSFATDMVILRCGSTASQPGVDVHKGSGGKVGDTTFKGLPAAGALAGLILCRMGASVEVLATVEGENTGTQAGLYAINLQSGAKIICSGALGDKLKGDDGRISAVNAGLTFMSTVSFAASFGGGPDMYLEHCLTYFADNLTKSAVNSETAIQSGVDGQITAGTKRFTSATAVFTAAHVGRSVKISVTINAGNVGVHEITAFIDANNVTLNNMAAPVNEGPGLTWGLVGTPRPIFEVARGGRISQADGKTFTVRIPGVEPAPGSGIQEWSKQGYGLANTGFAHIHEGGEAVLGTLALSGVGAAGAGGIAAKIKNASKLLHKGGAVILGTAPLDLGGNAGAIAWPATPSSDAAAAAPQQCIVIPNVP